MMFKNSINSFFDYSLNEKVNYCKPHYRILSGFEYLKYDPISEKPLKKILNLCVDYNYLEFMHL